MGFPNYSTTTRAKKKGWRKRFQRKISTAATKVGMRRKSREKEASSSFSSSHLIKEDSPRGPTNHVSVPEPEQKLGEVTIDEGSFRASDLVSRYVNQSVYSLTTPGV